MAEFVEPTTKGSPFFRQCAGRDVGVFLLIGGAVPELREPKGSSAVDYRAAQVVHRESNTPGDLEELACDMTG